MERTMAALYLTCLAARKCLMQLQLCILQPSSRREMETAVPMALSVLLMSCIDPLVALRQ